MVLYSHQIGFLYTITNCKHSLNLTKLIILYKWDLSSPKDGAENQQAKVLNGKLQYGYNVMNSLFGGVRKCFGALNSNLASTLGKI